MKRIADQCVQDILARTDIVQVVGDFVRLEKKGGRWWGCCPFHSERTPSFCVTPEKDFYYCFGCKKGGGAVSFLMELEKMSYPEALEFLAKKSGVELVYEQGAAAARDDERRASLTELNRRIAGAFHYILMNKEEGRAALDYLHTRGLNDDTLKAFSVGWAPEDGFWLYDFLSKKGYGVEFLLSSGLFSRKNPRFSFFRSRIIFPIADSRGEIRAFGGRLMQGDGPKYLNSSESDIFQKGRHLFGHFQALSSLKKESKAILCEGYMDVISLHQAGLTNAVAPLGTAFTESQAMLLKRLCDCVQLSFDSDQAGQAATERAAIICEKAGLDCLVTKLQGAKDASETLEKEGPDVLKKNMETAINVMDYLVQRAFSLDAGGISGKSAAIQSLFPYLESIQSEIRRESFIGLVSQRFGVDRQAIQADFYGRKQARPEKKTDGAGQVRQVKPGRELYLMLAVAVHRRFFPELRSALSPQDLEDADARRLFIALEEAYRNDDDQEAFLARVDEEGIRSLILEKASSGEFQVNPDRFVAESLRTMRMKILERRSAEVKASLAGLSAGEAGADSGVNDLMHEKMFIDAELARLKDDRE